MALDPTEIVELHRRLSRLKREHQTLDNDIAELMSEPSPNDLKVHRLKKEKLAIKDQIKKIENLLLPDIIA